MYYGSTYTPHSSRVHFMAFEPRGALHDCRTYRLCFPYNVVMGKAVKVLPGEYSCRD
jgi:hypothetical protein